MSQDKGQNQVFTNSKYQTSFLRELKRLYESQTLTDIILVCSESASLSTESIKCHKLVLSALSPYFHTMFTSDFKETKSNQIILPTTDIATLKLIVDYAYTGSIELSLSSIQSVFSLASLFQLEDVLAACGDFMETHLDVNNVLSVFHFAKCHQTIDLITSSRDFINKNITDIINETNEYLELEDIDLIIEIMSSDELNVPTEIFVLEGLVKWINHDYENREIHFARVFMACVRLRIIDTDSLRSFYKEFFHLVSTSPLIVSLIEDRLDLIPRNDEANGNEIKIRSGMNKPEHCFLIIGGNCDLDDGQYINCFNPDTGYKFLISRNFQDKAKCLTKGYFHVENPGVCVTENERTFVGGGNWVYHEYKLFNNNHSSKHSKSKQKNPRRRQYSASNIDDDNDSSDSYDDNEEMLSKEFFEYDKLHDTWIKRANMLFAKANFTLCAMDDRIYSFGGITVDQDQLDIVEYYDISENKWNYAGIMPHKFIAGCVVRHEDVFYVMGGRSGVGRFNNCYMFRPSTTEWTEINRMKVGRFNFGACVLENKIYIFGGQRYNESESYYTREALDSVEIYDLDTREWSSGPTMPSSLYNTAVCKYDEKSLYLCGTTECKFSGNTLIGFMFTSVFRLEFMNNTLNGNGTKWSVVEHEVTDIKSNYRCVATRLNTSKLNKLDLFSN